MKLIPGIIFLILANIAFSQQYDIRLNLPGSTDTTGLYSLFFDSGNKRTAEIINNTNKQPVHGMVYRSENGMIKKTGKLILLDPEDRSSMNIEIFKKKNQIGKLDFKVKMPPAPSATFFVPEKNVPLRNGSLVNLHERLTIRFGIDEEFRLSCPGDTVYTATEITIVKSGNIKFPQKVNGTFTLDGTGLRSGETIKLELNRYNRRNYAGKDIEFPASPEDYLILKIE